MLTDKIAAYRRKIDRDRIDDAVSMGIMWNDSVSEAVRYRDVTRFTATMAQTAHALAVRVMCLEANAHT